MSLFPTKMPPLPYRKPTEGRDFWVVDDVLPNAREVRERCLAKSDWQLGFPHTGEVWPGMRSIPALLDDELAAIDVRVCQLTGARKVWIEQTDEGTQLNHNCVQVVGSLEGAKKPHTDSLNLCRYAAVLYLNPNVPEQCGTSFFRQRLPGGQLGGNIVMPPHRSLAEALGNRFVPPDSLVEDVRVDHHFNRLLLYKANLIHSATAYWGQEIAAKRMTAVFFWMA